ncbi:UvrD-helicase domain-containing protein [Candidatus Peregrinibacteria bacterium]|nr:UvrD-helicase domain-containing protein [Candidatus Peregrinibacteria bacterium]
MHPLNAQQQAAVRHRNGPLLVVAGAGTGKTSVITHRIAHILNEGWCRHDEILALTFTDKATQEIEERVDQLMPLGYEAITIRTFHGFCDDLLREFGIDIGINPNFRILQGVAHWLFLKERLFEFDLDYYRPLGNPTAFIDAFIKAFARFKEELNTPEDALAFAEKKTAEAKTDEEKIEAKRLVELTTAYGRYQELLTENDCLDFADLQIKTLELFEKRPNILAHLQKRYRYILVDEYQDTNIAQNTIVDRLVEKHRNLTVVGDDDQSIYKFRGAAISNILQFQERYPDLTKIVLTENYRSGQSILDFAYASIQHNNPDRLEIKSGVDKRLKGRRPSTPDSIHLIHSTTLDQEVETVISEIQNLVGTCHGTSSLISLSEIAVLSRTNAQLQAFTEGFQKAGIPYNFISERGLYRKEEIRDLVTLLRVLANPTDDISFYRVLRMPFWKLSMELIMTLIAEGSKNYKGIYQQIKAKEECRLLSDTFRDLLEFSKNHTAGETLYRFTETVQLYQQLLAQGTIETEEQILNIATFFNKIREFEQNSENKTILDFVEYLDLAEEAGENPAASFELQNREGVFISTVHGAKGLEFHTVFLTNLTNDRFPGSRRGDSIEIPDEFVHEILTHSDTHLQEERRLFYVAVTRAKERLYLLHSDFYGQSFSKNPRKKKRSRFIDEIFSPEGEDHNLRLHINAIEKTAEGIGQFIKPSSKNSPEGEDPHPRLDQEPLRTITQFSYSQLMQFQTCPRQYEYQYVLKIPQPMSANLSFGSTMHTTLQKFYKHVLQQKQTSLFQEFEPKTSLEELLKIYDENWIAQGYESKAHIEVRKTRGREILTQFHEHFKEDVSHVRFLEKSFKLKIGNYTLSGRIDRADDLPDGTLEIIDYKTGRTRTEKEVENDLQLFLYAIAAHDCFSLKASRLTLYFLDEDVKISTAPDEAKFEQVKRDVSDIADAVNRSDFSPTPSQFKCRQCPYNKICESSLGFMVFR